MECQTKTPCVASTHLRTEQTSHGTQHHPFVTTIEKSPSHAGKRKRYAAPWTKPSEESPCSIPDAPPFWDGNVNILWWYFPSKFWNGMAYMNGLHWDCKCSINISNMEHLGIGNTSSFMAGFSSQSCCFFMWASWICESSMRMEQVPNIFSQIVSTSGFSWWYIPL